MTDDTPASDAPNTAETRHDFKTRLRSFAYSSRKAEDVRNTSTHARTPVQAQASAQVSEAKSRSSTASQAKVKMEMDKENLEPSKPLRKSNRKRSLNDENSNSRPPPKKKRTTTKQRSATDPHDPENNLVDSLRPGLMLVFIGLNPGLMTAVTGHAYAHPSNLFWKLLSWSGITSKRHHPNETHDLMDMYSIGNTNICARPTRSGDGLSKEELVVGAGILEDKIAQYNPEAVCIVGKGIWDVIYKTKTGKALKSQDFNYGWQDQKLWLGRKVNKSGEVESTGSRTFVATTTSGLAASMKPAEKLEVWKPLGRWVQEQRGEHVKEEDEGEEVKIKDEV